MTDYEEAIAAIHRIEDAVDDAVKAIRKVDKLTPSTVRFFNGDVDDMLTTVGRIEPARQRLLQRTQTSGPPDLAVPEAAGALADGLRA